VDRALGFAQITDRGRERGRTYECTRDMEEWSLLMLNDYIMLKKCHVKPVQLTNL